jgi:hypothetical protein
LSFLFMDVPKLPKLPRRRPSLPQA